MRLTGEITMVLASSLCHQPLRRPIAAGGTAGQGAYQSGGCPWAKAAQRAAFQRARAANAVFYALDPAPFTAATDGLYKATAATQDEEALAELIRGVVGQPA